MDAGSSIEASADRIKQAEAQNVRSIEAFMIELVLKNPLPQEQRAVGPYSVVLGPSIP